MEVRRWRERVVDKPRRRSAGVRLPLIRLRTACLFLPRDLLPTAAYRRAAGSKLPDSELQMRTITKKDLVNFITDALTRKEGKDGELSDDARANRMRVTKVLVKDVIQKFLDKITEELAAGNRLEFREFGVFEVKDRAARRAQNPRTLEKVQVPAKKVVKFKVGRRMRELVEGAGESPSGPSSSAAKPPQQEQLGAEG